MRTVAAAVLTLSVGFLAACGSSSGGGSGGLGGGLLGGSGTSASGSSTGSTGAGSGSTGTGSGSTGTGSGTTGTGSGTGSTGTGATGTGSTGTVSGAAGTTTGTATGTTGTASGAAGSTTGASGTSSGTCNTLAQVGAAITPTTPSTAAPVPAGGTLSDGTYAATAVTFYGADAYCIAQLSAAVQAGLGTIAQTYVLSGSNVQVVTEENGQEGRTSSTFTVSANVLTVDTTCSTGNTGTSILPFTAMGTTVLLFTTDPDCGTEVETLTKR